MDVGFNSSGSKLITASMDSYARIYNVTSCACTGILVGHEGEVSKALFSS